jgi:hypothetical protein
MSPNPEQYVQYPKNILAWRRHLSGNEWTVLTAIIDKIIGWNKESDAVSISQIMAETTMSRSNIRRALASMQSEDGPIKVIGHGPRGIPVYRILPCDRSAGGLVETTTGPPVSMVDHVTGPPVSTTTVALNKNRRVRKYSPLLENSKQGAEIQNSTHTSKEDGLVLETNTIPGDIATVGLDGQPMNQLLLFVDRKTKKAWFPGQEVDCLSFMMKITIGEAESILRAGDGLSFTAIRAILKETWYPAKDPKVKNRMAYICKAIRNHNPAERTKQTSPRTRRPPSFEPGAAQDRSVGIQAPDSPDEMPWTASVGAIDDDEDSEF